jgi:hypothetical protein
MLSLLIGVLTANSLAAQPGPRVVVAQSNSPAATFTARPAAGNVFQTVPDKAELFSSDLLVSLPGGTLTSKNGAITLKVQADFDSRSPLPILETALSLALPGDKDADLEVVFDRGRINLTNTKPDGAATVRVRFWDQNWKIVLESPKSRVTVELCGRWAAGTRFEPLNPKADPAKAPAPAASAELVVLSGSASVDVGGVSVAMRAPPGPADLRWNSLLVAKPQPQRLDKLPAWADPDTTLSEEGKKVLLASERFRKSRADDPTTAFDSFLNSTDPVNQRVALVTVGALDDLERLERTIGTTKSLEAWDFGVTVLRHWLGRARGHDQQLYQLLTTRSGYTDGQARIILQLLLGFTPDDLAQPESYQALINYLGHPKPVIRNLAAWHLVRLVPEGKSIAFKPNATDAEARQYQSEWQKLIPRGKLPPSPKKP